MREIKFRAWDNRRKRMMQPFLTFEKHPADGLITEKTHWHDENDMQEEWDTSNQVNELMQFTGRLDIGDTEIYESDIVTGDVSQVIGEDVTVCGIVTWGEDGLWMVDLPHLGQSIAMQALSEIVNIGNIYQNPELLKSNPPDSLTKK